MLSFRAMRHLPPRIPTFRCSSIIHRPLASVAQIMADARAETMSFYADFHRTNLDIDPLSCDWENFIFRRLFTVRPDWHDLTELEFLVTHLAKVPGKIRPLAYLPVQQPCLVFEAGGKYHFLNGAMDYVESFNGNFASDNDFLLAATKRPETISGTKHWLPDDLDASYAAVGKEQLLRKRAISLFLSSVLLGCQAASDFDWSKVKASKELNWVPCYDSGLECTRLEVPLDYSAPNTSAAGIAIVKYSSTGLKSAYLGPILFNPGGPGVSGVDAIVESGADFSAIFGAQYDIVGFDPRGQCSIHYSTPAASFFATDVDRAQWEHPGVDTTYPSLNTSADVIPTQRARYQLLGMLAKMQDSGNILQHITTDNVARDMLSITEAFGYEKLQYWGVSYGSVLGATFASMFPDKVGRLIIDGVMDGQSWYSCNITESMTDTDATLQTFFDGCAAAGPETCPFYAPTAAAIAANLKALSSSLIEAPIPVFTNISYGLFTYTYLRNVLFTALYSPYKQFPLLAQGLADLATGNATILYQMAEDAPYECPSGSAPNAVEFDQNDQEASIPTACGDGPVYSDTVSQLRESYEIGANLSSFWDMFGNWRLRCAGWKVHRDGHFMGPMGALNTSFPLLVVGNTADPVTPHLWALRTSSYFPGSALLTFDAPGHTSLTAVSSCITTHMRQYFQNGTLPAAGTVCSPDQELFPSPSSNETSSPSQSPS
ncbi:TAP-like protein-domain-containing protein [Mycena sanguinolenta]|nr:TAP-like protein-domain-containing protein [Mycena sanguinolenta]